MADGVVVARYTVCRTVQSQVGKVMCISGQVMPSLISAADKPRRNRSQLDCGMNNGKSSGRHHGVESGE